MMDLDQEVLMEVQVKVGLMEVMVDGIKDQGTIGVQVFRQQKSCSHTSQF